MPERDNAVSLWVDGAIHQGWTGVSCALNLDHLAGSFSLSLTADWLENGVLVSRPVRPGAACKLAIDGATVITGWVDSVAIGFGDGNHDLKISGRDRTGDLVDCSAEVREFQDQRLENIAATLCQPFGIKVLPQADTGAAFERFAVNVGDTVAACIERLVRQRGVMAWSDGLGNMVIGRGAAGRPVARLVRGVNVLSAEATFANDQRFSRVTVKGSRESTDDLTAAEIAQVEGTATDAAITRHRPLILVPETQGDTVNLTERAEWEVRVRAGRGRTINVKTTGWYHDGGLWRPGQAVSFDDDWLGTSGDWLISNVALNKDGGGTVASLTLCPPTAFDRLATPEKGSDV